MTVRRIADACKSRRRDVRVLCHFGPIANPPDARYILERCPEVDGFYGASSMERLPAVLFVLSTERRAGVGKRHV